MKNSQEKLILLFLPVYIVPALNQGSIDLTPLS